MQKNNMGKIFGRFKESYIKLSAQFMLSVAERFEKSFKYLYSQLMMADIKMILKIWLSVMFFSTLISYITSFAATLIISIILNLDVVVTIFLVLILPVVVASFVFLLFYMYPMQKQKRIKKNIETNLPFALTHMSALASSGLPPESIFEMIMNFEEYGEISKKAKLIVRNMNVFGMSSAKAIKEVADKVPSIKFRHVLNGIQTTIEKGGNLVKYLDELANNALLDYKLKRETYLKTLETYADLYTTILVAAPLMFLIVLGIMGIIGGDVFGFSVEQLMFLITWVILPLLNVMFIAFLEISYPGV